MIRNKWLLISSIILLIGLVLYRLPYPNVRFIGLGSEGILLFNLSSRTGMEIVEIATLLLFIVAVILFARSLTTHRAVFTVLMVITVAWLPMKAVEGYQFLFASGIDAVSYDEDESFCTYEGTQTSCEIELKNHSEEEVEFLLNIYDIGFEGSTEFLFDPEDLEPVTLQPRATHKIEILRTSSSDMDMSGSMNSFNIQIQDEQKKRDL